MSLKRSREAETPDKPDTPEQFESSAILDRGSKFIAIYSPSTPPKVLQAHPPFKSALHRILAWRRVSRQQSLKSTNTIYDTGSDEDGEKYAGKKLEKLLIDMNISGSVVVARWYGGVMLGPVRFDHITNAAREAIEKHTASSRQEIKKAKLDDNPSLTPEQEAEQKQKLVTVLVGRDNSIAVLRQLLADKKAKLESNQPESSQDKADKGTVKVPNYEKMPLATLKKLESAKDHTIAWILKQIEETEAQEFVSSTEQKKN